MQDGIRQYLRYYLDLLQRRSLFLLIPLILVAGVGSAVVISMPEIYRAEVAIQVEPQRVPANLGEAVGSAAPNEPLQLVQERVLTREKLSQLAQKFNLVPQQQGELSESETVDNVRALIRVARVEIGPLARPRDSPTYVFTVGFEHRSADIATNVVTELAGSILHEDIQARTERSANTARILEREVTGLRTQLASVESEIADFTQKNIGALPGRADYNLRQLDDRRRELLENDAALRALDDERRLLDLELRLKALMGGESTRDVQNIGPRLEGLRAQLLEKSSVYSASHPEIRSLKQQISALEGQVSTGLAQLSATGQIDPSNLSPDLRLVAERLNTLNSRREFLAGRREALLTSVSTLHEEIGHAPEVESVLRRLQRQRDDVQRMVDDLAPRLSAVELRERLESDPRAQRLRLLEPPRVPTTPAKPNRLKLLALVIGAALVAGVGCIFAVDTLDQTIRSSRDLRMIVEGASILCIPYISTRSEQRQRKRKLAFRFAALGVLMIGGIAAIHTYIIPVEAVIQKLQSYGN